METTRIVRRFDDLGRIIIPKDISSFLEQNAQTENQWKYLWMRIILSCVSMKKTHLRIVASGTKYNDKAKAQNCEKGHCKPVEIIKSRYVSFDNNLKGYPVEITVKMTDGTEQKYKR